MKRTANVLLIVLTISVCGCSWHARKLLKVEEKISERVKENVQIADEALDALPPVHRTRQTDIASQAVHDAAVLTGYPLEDQKPFVALLLSDNEKLRKDAEDAWAAKRKSDQKLRTIQMHQLRELQTLGQQAEDTHNQGVVKRAWHWLIATIGIGGIVALCVFVPAALPFILSMVGRIFAWIVAAFPKMAGWLKVVGVDAYDAVVRGVEKAKNQNGAVKVVVEDQLSKTMDTPHKNLVLERKAVIADEDLQAAKKKAEITSKIEKTVQETEIIQKPTNAADGVVR